VINAFASPHSLEDSRFLIDTIRRNQDCYRLANGLFGRIAEQSFSAAIPACDGAFQVLSHYGIVGRLDDSGEMGGGQFSILASCDFDQEAIKNPV
jgi:hypothetical protein